MITIFAIPKPFHGYTAMIQRNAINSWLKLQPKCEIILFGDDEGVSEIAEELDLIHVQHITKTEYGTPLLDSAFRRAQDLARNDTMCYVNSDIILMSDLIKSLDKIKFDKFLLAGQRWDLDVKTLLDFELTDWEDRLRRIVNQQGILHPPAGIDYFVFSRNCIGTLPPFAVGRLGWDNWFIYNSRAKGVPVIDATERVMAVHQNHGYHHIPQRTGEMWEGPESVRNLELMGKKIYEWSLEDADWLLSENGLMKKSLTIREICRKLTLATPTDLHPILEALFNLQSRVRHK